MVVKNRVLSHYGKRPIWETSLVRWDSDTGMRTPQSSVKSPSKRHIPSHSRSRLACPSGTEEWPQRGQEGSSAGPHSHPPFRSWAATHLAPKPMAHYHRPFQTLSITEEEVNAMRFKCQFLQEPDISDKSLRLLLKRKFNFLIINYFMWRKRHCYNGSKPFLSPCDSQSSF